MDNIEGRSVVFFDGVCNLCNGFIDFMIRKDKGQKFVFSSLQNSKSQKLLSGYPGINPEQISTVILLHKNQVYQKSKAVSQIFLLLGGLWFVMGWLMKVVPGFVSDRIYDFIASRRYRILGKRDSCRVPSEEESSFFL